VTSVKGFPLGPVGSGTILHAQINEMDYFTIRGISKVGTIISEIRVAADQIRNMTQMGSQ
jgi:hypothetical protein